MESWRILKLFVVAIFLHLMKKALRVLRLMPRWKPAVGYYQQPRFMKCRYTVPVIFTDPGK